MDEKKENRKEAESQQKQQEEAQRRREEKARREQEVRAFQIYLQMNAIGGFAPKKQA